MDRTKITCFRSLRWACAFALALMWAWPANASPLDHSPPRAQQLLIDAIEVTGNTRTPARLIIAASGLEAGHPVDPTRLFVAADRVRARSLVRSVQVRAKRGTEPGRVTVVFDVEERTPHLRLGLGYEDLSGWYLVPLQLNLDNVMGYGEYADLSVRLGLRTQGLVARYRRVGLHDPRHFWELRARVEAANPLYFLDEREVTHPVGQGGLEFSVGRPLTPSLALTGWVGSSSQDVDSTAVVYADRRLDGSEVGDDIAFGTLPAAIQDEVGETGRVGVGAALEVDTRSGSVLGKSGWWGQTSIEVNRTSREETFAEWHVDLRRYVPVSDRSQLAFRARAGAVGSNAPFTDRLYLGGLYTVRGFPTQSLAPPNGFTRSASASVEFRHGWTDGRDPRVIGLLFADAGIGGGADDSTEIDGVGVGYGIRVRVPWLGHLGVDVGFPLTNGPVDEAFHAHAGIGWTY